MKRILVDMDGVLADVYHRFLGIRHEKVILGKRYPVKDIIGLKESLLKLISRIC